jgi:hypothetical protein
MAWLPKPSFKQVGDLRRYALSLCVTRYIKLIAPFYGSSLALIDLSRPSDVIPNDQVV